MKILKLIGFLLIVNSIDCQCNIPPVLGPDPVPSLPTKYQVRVDINTENELQNTEMRFYYDNDQRRAAVETRQNNINTRLIFNYDTDEIYELKNKIELSLDSMHYPPDGRPEFPTTCTAYKLSNTSTLNYYFGFVQSGANVLPGPAYQAFDFNPIAYGGNETVRGIPCDIYKSCYLDQVSKTNFVVTHYFSQRGFNLAGADRIFNRLPIRAIYERNVAQPDGTTVLKKTVFDYHDFKTFVERRDIFQTPSGVFCKNRKVTKSAPSPTLIYGFSQEITNLNTNEIQYLKDYYTIPNFTRYEIRNPRQEEATFYTTDPVVYISELGVGIQYGINQRHGNCSVQGIKSDSVYLPKVNQTFNNLLEFISQIQSSQTFLNYDSEFIYTGQRESNGIPSDRFITNKTSGVYEYTFSDNSYVIFNSYEPERQVPISLYADNQRSGINSHSSFYNYEVLPPSNLLRLFDVSQCFSSQEVIEFDIVIPYRGIVSAEDIAKVPKLDMVLFFLISELTEEATLRFKPPTVSVSLDGNVYVRTSINPLPPPIKFFTLIERKILAVPSINSYSNVTTAEDCARYCINNKRCLSFDHSPGFKSCHLNNRTVTDGTVSGTTSYDHYTRNVPEQRTFLEDVEVLNLINNLVVDKKVFFSVPTYDENNQMTAKPLYAKEVIERRGGFNRFGTTNILSRYKLVHPKSKFLTFQEVQFSGLTIDDCAKNCNEQVGYDCNLFDYCYQTGDCRLRRYTDSENATQYLSDENCDVYEKDALSHYDRFRSKVSVNPKDMKYTQVKDPSECAKKCDKESKINCKSFNYCPLSSLCYLSTSHLTDASSSFDGNSTCDHYSRKFISDFTFIGKTEIKLIGEVVLSDSNLELCSAYCVTANGINCKSFEYCESSKTCIINSGSSNVVLNPNVQTDTCGHYRRDYFYETNQFYNSKSKTNDKTGLTIGLSVGFGFLSLVGGIVGTVFFFQRVNKK